jgi:hypothetical protein
MPLIIGTFVLFIFASLGSVVLIPILVAWGLFVFGVYAIALYIDFKGWLESRKKT